MKNDFRYKFCKVEQKRLAEVEHFFIAIINPKYNDCMAHLEFAQSSSTSNFLRKLKYVQNEGKSRSSRWKLK